MANRYETIKPRSVKEKVAEYIIARMRDYQMDDEDFFSKLNRTDHSDDFIWIEQFYNMQLENEDALSDFDEFAMNFLDMELSENAISNMEEACRVYYDTMLSSDIEILIEDIQWSEVVERITTE